MIRFAGVDCLLSDSDGVLAEFLQRTELDHFDLFGASPSALTEPRNHAISHAQPLAPLPVPNYPAPPAIRLNQLYWPTGAARWSHCVVLVDQDRLDDIYAAIGTTTVGTDTLRLFDPVQLVIGDSDYDDPLPSNGYSQDSGGHAVISTGMYPLDPRPVSLPTDGAFSRLWLLPLVDERYFWQWLALPHRADTVLAGGETEESILQTWDGFRRVLEEIITRTARTSLPRTLDWVPVGPAAELYQPDVTSLWQPQHNVAVILDAFAHSCGYRFVRQFDASLQLIDADESLTRHGANVASYSSMAGGMVLSPLLAGGVPTSQQSAASFPQSTVVPEFIDVVFRKAGETSPDGLPADAAGPGPAYNTMEVKYGIGTRTIRVSNVKRGYENVVPYTVKTVYTPTWVSDKLFDTGAPAGAQDSAFYGDRHFRMADIVAQETAKWMEQRHEIDLVQFAGWTLTGYDDHVTWRPDRGGTHVTSLPYNFGVDTMLIQAFHQADFDPDYQEGYLLENLEVAEVSGGTLTPKLARMAVFTLFAEYDSESGSRHDDSNWSFNWIRTGQLVVCNLDESLEADLKYPIACKRIGQTWRPVWVGCQETDLEIGAVI